MNYDENPDDPFDTLGLHAERIAYALASHRRFAPGEMTFRVTIVEVALSPRGPTKRWTSYAAAPAHRSSSGT